MDVAWYKSPVIGKLDPPTSIFVKNDYQRWNEHGPIVPTVFPVDVHPNRMGQALENYRSVELDIDPDVMAEVVRVYTQFITTRPFVDIPIRVLTLEEAILGVPGIVDPLDHSASPGYPWNQYPGGRSSVYTVTDKGVLVWGSKSDEFKSLVNRFTYTLMQGNTPGFVAKDSLKSELRKEAKRLKPRLISGATLTQTVLFKMYFATYFAYLTQTNLSTDRFIGMDPVRDWDHMERKFRHISGGIRNMTGDYSAYDGPVVPEFMEILASIANAWYGDSDDSSVGRLRLTLARSSVVQYHAFGDVISLWLNAPK